jgi:hypothetical protein
MLIRSRNRDRSRGGSVALSSLATAYLNGVTPYHYADYITNRMLYAGADVGTVAGGTGYSFTRASDGYYTNSDGTLTLFGSGALRRGDRGVLIEGARTNLLTYSQEFDNASWTKDNATVTANATTAPDGTTTADLFYPTATGGASYIFLTEDASSNTWSMSFFAKPAGKNVLWLNLVSFADRGVVYFDLSDQTIQVVAGSVSTWTNATCTPLANGWFRCSATSTAAFAISGSEAQAVGICDAKGSTLVTASGTDGIFIWGAQLEAASFPSSYIPTVAASATRAADVLTYTAGVSYPLTLWAEITLNAASTLDGNGRIAVETRNTAADRAIIYNINGDMGAFSNNNNNTESVSLVSGSLAANTISRMGFRVATDNFRFAKDNVLGATDTSGLVPATPNSIDFGNGGSLNQLFGHIRRAAIFNSALTDAQLQTVTGS